MATTMDKPLLGVGAEDYGSCPHDHLHPKNRRYCRCLSYLQCVFLTVAIVLVVVLAVVLGLIFGAGRKYAQISVNDADITMQMQIYNPTDKGFSVHVTGSIDNRNVLDATLKATTLRLGSGPELGKHIFGEMPFPQIQLQGGSVTPLDLHRELLITNQEHFDYFSTSLLQDSSVMLNIDSDVDVSAAGISYKSLPFRKTIILKAFNKFRHPAVEVTEQIIYHGTAEHLYANLSVQMDNETPVAMSDLGPVSLDVYLHDELIGVSRTEGFMLPFNQSSSVWQTTITPTATNQDLINELLSDYANGDTATLSLRGNANSSSLPLFKNSFSQLELNASLPGLLHNENKLVQFASVLNMSVSGTPKSYSPECEYQTDPPVSTNFVKAYLFTHNPFDAAVTLSSVDFDVKLRRDDQYFTGDQFLAHSRTAPGAAEFVIPPHETYVQTQTLCLRADFATWILSSQGLLGYLSLPPAKTLDGIVPFLMPTVINGTIQGKVGDFVAPLAYRQEFSTSARFLEAF